MASFLGRIVNMISGPNMASHQSNPVPGQRGNSGNIQNDLHHFRTSLMKAVSEENAVNIQSIVDNFVALDVPLKEKFMALNVIDLLKKNSENLQGIKHIISGLGTIIKCARHLCKDVRLGQWGTIRFSNPHVQRKILPLKGFQQVLAQLGYTELSADGQSFPSDSIPDKETVVKLIADMELFRVELKAYCLGKHQHPENIGQYLSQELRDELEEMQVKGLSMMEGSDGMTGSSLPEETLALQSHSASKSAMVSQEQQDVVDAFPQTPFQAQGPPSQSASSGRISSASNALQKSSSPEYLSASSQSPGMGREESGSSETALMEVRERQRSGNVSSEIPGLANNVEGLAIGETSELNSDTPVTASGGTSDSSSNNKLICSVCGEDATYVCRECDYDQQMALCDQCNLSWHKHQNRRSHNPQRLTGCQNHSKSRLRSESFGSNRGGLLIDDYGVTAYQRPGKKQQTMLAKSKGTDNWTQPQTNTYLTPNKDQVSPLAQQSEDYRILEYQRQQVIGQQQPSQTQNFQQTYSPQLQQQQNNLNYQQQVYRPSNTYSQPGHPQMLPTSGQMYPVSVPPPAASGMFNNMQMPPRFGEAPSQLVSSSIHYPQSQGMKGEMNRNAVMQPPMMVGSVARFPAPQQMTGTYTVASGNNQQPMLNNSPTGNQAHTFMSMAAEDQNRLPQYQKSQDETSVVPASLPPYIQRQILEEQNARQRLPYGSGQPWNGPQSGSAPYRLPHHLQEQTYYVGSQSGASPYGAPMSMGGRPYAHAQGQSETIPLTRLQPSLMSQVRPQHYSQIAAPQQYPPPMPVGMMGNRATNPFLYETNNNMAYAPPKPYDNMAELESSGYPSQIKTPRPENNNQQFPRYPAYADPSLTNFMYNTNLQSPLSPQTPLSSTSLLSSSTSSMYVRRLLSEQNLSKRKAMCEVYINNIKEDRQNLEEEMEIRMEDVENFSSTQECQDLLRRKEEMVKEKRTLLKFLKQLDLQINSFYSGVQGGFGDQQEIYFPPEVGGGEPSKALPTNLSSSVADDIVRDEDATNTAPQSSSNVLPTDGMKAHYVDNGWVAEATATGNIGLSYAKASFESALSRPRVPVEDSVRDPQEPLGVEIPPALPPRSTKPVVGKPNNMKSILDMPVPAPEIIDSPPISNRKWECEHCTFLNPATIHICQMCDRTSDNAKIIEAASEEINMSRQSQGVDEDLENISEELDKTSLLDIVKAMKEDGAKQKNLFDDDEEGVEYFEIFDNDPIDKEQNKGASDRIPGDNIPKFIKGSQEQVMEEKKRAKLEFERKEKLRQQQQMSGSTDIPHDFKETEAMSPGNTSSKAEGSGGARPKQSTHMPNPSPPMEKAAFTNSSNSSLITIEDSLAKMEEMKAIERLHTSGAQLIKLIKQADAENFDVQAVQIAIEICESMKGTSRALEPLAWLRENWQKNVCKIATMAQTKGADLSPNDVGEVSFAEAERAYISCQGNMKEAVEKCVLDRQALYAELSAVNEAFAREDILSAMMASEGDSSAAKVKLEQAILQPFENRIWEERQQRASDSFNGSEGNLANQTAGATGVSNVRMGAAVGIAVVGTALALATHSSSVAKATAGLVSMVYPNAPNEGSVDDVQNNNAAAAAAGNVGAEGGIGVEDVGVMLGPNNGEAMAAYNPLLSLSTSIIGHKQFQDMLQDQSLDFERRVRMIFVEGRLHSWGRAELVVRILDQENELKADLAEGSVTLEDIVEAVRDCQDRASALAYLRQECQICFSYFPMNKIMSLNICQCRLCQECMVAHFEVVIKEKHVRHWVCPQCSQPDLSDPEVASNYLQFLGMQLQAIVSRELQDLFETKTRDWHLQKMEHFRWCAHCAEGFLADNRQGQLRMRCPQCGESTCYECKRQWEDQHEGLTCEEYSQWKVDNDPNNQSVGLAKHLDENGIDCPNCKMRFDLAKGGCMHFKCPQCGHEFCSGCNEPYHHKNMCTKYKACKNLGLHCHCPRDCFSFLRDYIVPDLQKLLKDHQVVFNVAAPPDQADPRHCPVMEQKESDLQRHRDEKCGRDALDGGAGLCENHYKEYLAMLINARGLDPVILMSKEQMEALLKRFDVPPPRNSHNTPAGAYKTSLVQLITQKLPLRKRK